MPVIEMTERLKTETISIVGLQSKLALSNNSSNIKWLVIMLHGWSINSDYMSKIFPFFLNKCNNQAFYAQDASYICPLAEIGR